MIPIIDLSSPLALRQIEDAYTTVGFAVFTNALSDKENTDMKCWQEEMKAFFALPNETKESYNYTNHRMPEHLWPTELNGFKANALQSIDIADKLTLRILGMFDTILDSGTTLVDAHQKPFNTTRVIRYPAVKGDLEEKQMRIGEHSDYGTITLLWQINDVPGLEVQDLGGKWHPVPYADDGVVVNIGDLLARWTNDYFKSTKHRVVNSHIHLERYSMPHFVDPTPGTIVDNLRFNEASKYPPIESLEYLQWRLAQSY